MADINVAKRITQLYQTAEDLMQLRQSRFQHGIALYCDYRRDCLVAISVEPTFGNLSVSACPYNATAAHTLALKQILDRATVGHGVDAANCDLREVMAGLSADMVAVADLDLDSQSYEILDEQAMMLFCGHLGEMRRLNVFALELEAKSIWEEYMAARPVMAQADYIAADGSAFTCRGYVTGKTINHKCVLAMTYDDAIALGKFINSHDDHKMCFDREAHCFYRDPLFTENGAQIHVENRYAPLEVAGMRLFQVGYDLPGWQPPVEVEKEHEIETEER